MSISAMKCALQSLESVEKVNGWNKDSVVGRHCTQSAHFLRQAIAEAEKQEPYGHFRYDIKLDAWVQNKESTQGVAFYTAPLKCEWVDLTEDEIFKLYMNSGYGDIDDCLQFEGLARVIEAKLKEKNT